MRRRDFLVGCTALGLLPEVLLRASPSKGMSLAQAARAQIGVTKGYDPSYAHLTYPNGDVSRSTGICADVVIRAIRDGLSLDLQKLVHDDMLRAFDTYTARRVWGEHGPDSSIDHRRVLNLQTFWNRAGAEQWRASKPTPGDEFPKQLEVGDFVTWLIAARLPHVGVVVSTGAQARVVHNIGNGAEETPLAAFHTHRAAGHYRWPSAT